MELLTEDKVGKPCATTSLIFTGEILADDAKFFICHENEALIANVFANNQSKCSMKINAFCHHQRSIV
jgi:hypothetical protein